MDLLDVASQSPRRCLSPAPGFVSKRKQAHTIVAESIKNDDDASKPSLVEPNEFKPELEVPYQQYNLLESLDSLLVSRQNSGVFLKDPDVCLMDWSTIAPAPAVQEAATEQQQHPALQELYSSFQTRGTDAVADPSAAASGISIIPLTPDQVSHLTAAASPCGSDGCLQIVTSPATMETAATIASNGGQQPKSKQQTARRRPRQQQRRCVADASDASDEDDVDDSVASLRGVSRGGVNDGDAADPDYRRRRERNNVAVRKSRAKTRAREQAVDQTLGRLRLTNDELRKKVESVVRELKFLKSLMNKTRMPLPAELLGALRNYPNYFEPVE
ncbi:hypothetical protein BOX15_Mlig016954g1 [Macrostomum lignano]|uniref:BZIP domain-containing protein n=1 Tax=Macrostomum lignano TaxID=282301 RepID=A0A267DN23_9PLAT|nr:hypothetical protein BOX15_Mlig016954g2 [Macrostomum lignano]PAA84492.1 hypothetical protein BOX15_Mlig016954g1 [Macrostomum lignano]